MYVVAKIDENVVFDFSNQIAKAGLATHQKLGAFITGAADINIGRKSVPTDISETKL